MGSPGPTDEGLAVGPPGTVVAVRRVAAMQSRAAKGGQTFRTVASERRRRPSRDFSAVEALGFALRIASVTRRRWGSRNCP